MSTGPEWSAFRRPRPQAAILFLGQDPTYGSLSGIDGYEDGVSAEAPHLTFQIQPPSNAAAAALCNPTAQGSQVTLWLGAVNRSTGLAIAPYQMWQGDLDTMTLAIDRGARLVKMDAESIWDRFFDTDEGILLDNATHQAIWPGELGLEYVTEVQAQIPWGSDSPRPVVVTDVIGGSPDYTNGIGGYNPNAYSVPGIGGGGGGFGGFTMPIRRSHDEMCSSDAWRPPRPPSTRFRDQPLRWGRVDCAKLASLHLKQLGVTTAGLAKYGFYKPRRSPPGAR